MQRNLPWLGRLSLILATIVCGGAGWAAAIPAGVVGASPGSKASPSGLSVPPPTQARLAWQVIIPLRSVDAIKSCHLVEGYIYAICAEGTVHCLRADTGRLLWSRQLTEPPSVIYPPVAYRSAEFYGVAFTLSSEVVFLDPDTGSEYKRIRLLSPGNASSSNAPDLLFSAETNRRLRVYDIKDGVLTWQILAEGLLTIPPAYQPDLQTVVFADNIGVVAMVWGTDKEEVYARKLRGTPQGWIESDVNNFYVATSDNLLYCLDRITGETLPLWPYRLPSRPEGGPVLCGGSIYQALAPRGVQQISIEHDKLNWCDPEAVKFLCQWNGWPALLHSDGRIAIINPATGQVGGFIDAGPIASAISNTSNEALLLLSPANEICCYQPADASVTLLASFRPPTTQPTTQPATSQPSSRPTLARKPKQNDEGLLLGGRASSGANQQGAGPNAGRSNRSRGERSSTRSRSSRGGGGEGRSSRGSRGSHSSRGSRGGRSGRGSSSGRDGRF